MPTDKFEELLKQIRVPIWLTKNTNFYVRLDGNNNNDGLSNSPEGAFKTIQYALNTISENYNLSIYDAILHIGPGIWTEQIGLIKYTSSSGIIKIVGNGIGLTILQSGISRLGQSINVISAVGTYEISNLEIESSLDNIATAGNRGPIAINSSGVTLGIIDVKITCTEGDNITAGTYAVFDIRSGGRVILGSGVIMQLNGTSLGASTLQGFNLSVGGSIQINAPVTYNGQGRTTIQLASASTFGRNVSANGSFVGSFVGRRYIGSTNSIFSTFGGPNFFPGTEDGTLSTGAQYI